MKHLLPVPYNGEQAKGNRLTYAYTVPSRIAIYPIFGSLIRALGKGWNILLIIPDEYRPQFQLLLTLLKDPQHTQILSFDEVTKIGTQDLGVFDVVINMYSFPDETKIICNQSFSLAKSHTITLDQMPDYTAYDLISDFKISQLHKRGVTAITGGGKGKTTTALGIALESFLAGEKVAVIQWFKEKKSGLLTWAINEHRFPETLISPEHFMFYPTGAGFVGSPQMDRIAEASEHRHRAKEGVILARKLIHSQEYKILILDEFVDTLPEVMPILPYRLLEVQEVKDFLLLAEKSQIKVVVTGRQVTPEWEGSIQNSIVISEIKHPWSSKHAGAISGLDF